MDYKFAIKYNNFSIYSIIIQENELKVIDGSLTTLTLSDVNFFFFFLHCLKMFTIINNININKYIIKNKK